MSEATDELWTILAECLEAFVLELEQPEVSVEDAINGFTEQFRVDLLEYVNTRP